MAYQIKILPAALRQLEEIPRSDQKRIRDRIDGLADDPWLAGVKRLRGTREFLRIRSGNYRIIYTVERDRLTVLIIKIGHRRDVYRHL
jgi:mRNA interferase RelE/StbE